METVMQYLLMIYDDESAFAKAKPEDMGQLMGAYQAYTEALRASGAMLGSNRLRETNAATTVRVVDGKTQVLDGPYADTKEQLGGFHIIDVPDLDAAIAWAARSPTALHGVVEVRPIRNPSIANLMSESDPISMSELIDELASPKPPDEAV